MKEIGDNLVSSLLGSALDASSMLTCLVSHAIYTPSVSQAIYGTPSLSSSVYSVSQAIYTIF